MTRRPTALMAACLDTKGREAVYIKDRLAQAGVDLMLLDASILGRFSLAADFTPEQVARAGGMSLEEVRDLGHEGRALQVMTAGAVALAQSVADRVDGVIGLGGSMGTTLGSAVMRSFPLGVPKVMVSTMASRDTRAFVGAKDICLIHAVADLAGLNRVTQKVLANAAGALAGMIHHGRVAPDEDRPLLALSTLGTTEAAARELRRLLGEDGFEVVAFHTVGAGGQALEDMVADGGVDVVLDLSLHELADHRFGGDYDAGPRRGYGAGEAAVPFLLVPGNIDFLVTGPEETARRRFPGRPYHVHNAAITVVRSTPEEAANLAEVMADIAEKARGPVEIAVPLGGFSAFDHPENGPMPNPDVPPLVAKTLEKRLKNRVPLHISPHHINDGPFIEKLAAVAGRLGAGR